MKSRFHPESNGEGSYYTGEDYQFTQFIVKNDNNEITPKETSSTAAEIKPVKKVILSADKPLPPISETDYAYNAEEAHYWADWIASILGDMADIAFGLQPLFNSPVFRLIPFIGLTPIIAGFTFKWLLSVYDLKKEEVKANRYMTLITTIPLIVLTFLTFAIELPQMVMMGILGVSIVVEAVYSAWNLGNAILKYIKHYGDKGDEQKELSTEEKEFYQSLSSAQCIYLRKNPEKITLLAEGNLTVLTKDIELTNNKAHQKLYQVLQKIEPLTAEKLMLNDEQLSHYYKIVAMRHHKREYQHEIADRAHILGYTCLALVGAILTAIPGTQLIGCIVLIVAGVWGFLDKVNINTSWLKKHMPFMTPAITKLEAMNIHTLCLHPFKMLMNKLFDNILSPPQRRFIPEVGQINQQARALYQGEKAAAALKSTKVTATEAPAMKQPVPSAGVLLTKLGINGATTMTATKESKPRLSPHEIKHTV